MAASPAAAAAPAPGSNAAAAAARGRGGDSSDEDSDVEMDPQAEQAIMQLEAALEANPRDYDAHVKVCAGCACAHATLDSQLSTTSRLCLLCRTPKPAAVSPHKHTPHTTPLHAHTAQQLIAALQAAKLAVRLRAARERMAALFPLDEGLWLAWIHDAMAALADASDLEYVKQLHARAAQDYLSVTLLTSHLQ